MTIDKELLEKIERVNEDFHGQADDLFIIVGMIVAGRRYGWRVVRLASSRRHWSLATKHFGDLKQLMLSEGDLAYKSRALKVLNSMRDFWEVVRGHKQMPLDDRRGLV
jgi:hypothetical protein